LHHPGPRVQFSFAYIFVKVIDVVADIELVTRDISNIDMTSPYVMLKEPRVGVSSSSRSDCAVSLREDALHATGFTLPVLATVLVLDDAERVYPEIGDIEFSSYCDSVLESLWQLRYTESLQASANVVRSCTELLLLFLRKLAPAVGQSDILPCGRFSGTNETNPVWLVFPIARITNV
jgi:hypothetical protein